LLGNGQDNESEVDSRGRLYEETVNHRFNGNVRCC